VSDFWIEFRPGGADFSGGTQLAMYMEHGTSVKRTVSWNDPGWNNATWPNGTPKHDMSYVLANACALVMVGNLKNDITVTSLEIPGYTPP